MSEVFKDGGNIFINTKITPGVRFVVPPGKIMNSDYIEKIDLTFVGTKTESLKNDE